MERLLNLEVTSYCNANCSMCPRDCVRDYGYISLDTVEKLTDKVENYLLYEIFCFSIVSKLTFSNNTLFP